MRAKRRPSSVLAATLLGAGAVIAALYFKPLPALEDASLLHSDSFVRVERRKAGILFLPASAAKASGMIFYCGARIPPEAYAYLGRACAQAGFATVLASMPLNFATLDPSRAVLAAAENPGVARWIIAGHSLGGRVAADFVARNAAAKKGALPVAGLLLLASYPDGNADLSTKSLPVVTVGASCDALVAPAKIAAARGRLPSSSRYIEIAGGNHAQFGEYGPQPGDGHAEIPGTTQRKATVEEALVLFGRVEAGAGK